MNFYVFFLILMLINKFIYASELQFDGDVLIKETDKNEFEKITSGQSFTIKKDSSYFILSAQNIPLLLVTKSDVNSQILLTNQDFAKIFDEKTNKIIDEKTNAILNSLRKAEALLLKKDFGQALTVLNQTKEKHNNISAVLFLSGTLNSLMNNKKMAIEDLEKGLLIDPQNLSAQNMLKKLKESR